MSGRPKLRYRYRREFELLAACASKAVDSRNRWPELTAEIDWAAFLHLADRHRVVPQVTSVLVHEAPFAIPAEVVDSFRAKRDGIVRNNLRLASELVRVARTFDRGKIPLMAIKGPTLAAQLYGGLDRRQFVDLDILVRPDDLFGALTLLADLGFQARSTDLHSLSPRQLDRVRADSKSTDLYRCDSTGTTQLDLHWRLSNDPAFFPTETGRQFERALSMSISGQSILTMDQSERLEYLAFHGGNHRWMRLSWLCDLGRALKQYPHAEWNSLICTEQLGAADGHQLNRYLASGMLLLQKLGFVEDLPAILDPGTTQRLHRVVDRMYQVLSADEAAPLMSVLADGIWRYQFTGRVTPLMNSITRFLKPKPRDLCHDGLIRPYLSRWRYIVAAAFGGLKSDGS